MDVWAVKISVDEEHWMIFALYAKEVSANLHSEFLGTGHLHVKVEKIHVLSRVPLEIANWGANYGKGKSYTG